VLLPLSGELKEPGQDQLKGFKLALQDRSWSLAGHAIELDIVDSHCSREGGVTGALKITADPLVAAIFGTYCSIAATGASEIVSEAGLVMISAGNTAPSLTSLGDVPGQNHQPGYFRTAHNDVAMGKAVADFARKKLSLSRAATLNDGDPYTSELTAAFAKAFQNTGGEVVLQETINKGDKDMTPVLQTILQARPQMLFFPIFSPAGERIVRQARQLRGAQSLAMVTGAGLFDEAFYEQVGEAGQGLYFVVPGLPRSKEYQAFLSRFKKVYKAAPKSAHFAHAYDAGGILLSAMQAASTHEEDGSLSFGRQALREAIQSISGYQGVTGRLSCNRFGDCGQARFKIVRLDHPGAGFQHLASNIIYTYEPRH